jgi:hypothetical protein
MRIRDVVFAVCLAVVVAGCGTSVQVTSVSFQNVGDNPTGRHTIMALYKGDTFDRVVSLLPARLPPSSRLLQSDGCYEVTFSVRLSNDVRRVYRPCVHPKSIIPAIRAMCRAYFGLHTILADEMCAHLQ